MELYTVQYLGNISGGHPIRYVNAPIDDLKALAIKKLSSGKPVRIQIPFFVFLRWTKRVDY